MFIIAGPPFKVSSNLTGIIKEFMPPEVLLIYQTTQYNGIISWQKDSLINTLESLQDGEIYYVVTSTDMEVPAFADPEELSRAIQKEYVLKTESEDENFGHFPEFLLQNGTNALVKFYLAGRDDDAYFLAKEVTASVFCTDLGVAILLNALELYSYGVGDLDLDVAGSSLVIRPKNTTVGFVGTTKWALKISMTIIKPS